MCAWDRSPRASRDPAATSTASAGWRTPAASTPRTRSPTTQGHAAWPSRRRAPRRRARSAKPSVAAAGRTGKPVSRRQAHNPRASSGSSSRSAAGSSSRGSSSGQSWAISATTGSMSRRLRASISTPAGLSAIGIDSRLRTCSNVSECSRASTGSNGCWSTPELRPEAAPASSPRSNSSTRTPASARKAAAAQPMIPPPMIATSGRALTATTRDRGSVLVPARVVHDRLVDEPLDRRLVVGVDLAAA